MNKRVSLKDIAEKVGVSTALVSYVINGQEKEKRVGEEMATKIRQAANELNYNPNQIARSLRKGATKTIGLIVADIANPFFGMMARVVEDEANKRGYTVIFGSSDEDPEKSKLLIESLMNRQVDGFIIAPVENTEEQIIKLKERKVPVVLVDRFFQSVPTDYVVLDNFSATFEAVSYLLRLGYQRIGMVGYHSTMIHMQDRFAGGQEAMKKHEGSILGLGEIGFTDMKKDVKRVLDKFTKGKEKMDAIVFVTNSLTLAGLYYFKENGIKIPEDVAIVGFDGNAAFDFFYAPLTYIEQPIEEMGKKSVGLLLDQVSGSGSTVQVKLEHLLVERASTG